MCMCTDCDDASCMLLLFSIVLPWKARWILYAHEPNFKRISFFPPKCHTRSMLVITKAEKPSSYCRDWPSQAFLSVSAQASVQSRETDVAEGQRTVQRRVKELVQGQSDRGRQSNWGSPGDTDCPTGRQGNSQVTSRWQSNSGFHTLLGPNLVGFFKSSKVIPCIAYALHTGRECHHAELSAFQWSWTYHSVPAGHKYCRK